MPKSTVPLTDTQVRNAKNPDKTEKKIFDGGGLYLTIDPKGNKGWRFKYRLHGKERRMSFGSYPEVGLSRAREKRQMAKELIDHGLDPVEERQKETLQNRLNQDNTFKRIALEWHSQQINLAEKTKNLHIRRLEQDVFPKIGSKPIGDITPKQILDSVLRPMENRGVGELTYRVKSIISQIYRYAVAAGYTDRDITVDFLGALKKVNRSHRAAITDPNELAKLLRSIDGYDGYKVVKYALQLAPLFFVRPGELRAMQWADVNLPSAEWRYHIGKTKSDHIVPLATQAVAVLKELQLLTGSGTYVFPSVRSVSRPISDNTLNAALRRMGYTKEEVTTHGFRATARTILEEVLQERIEYIEHQLAHSVKDALGRAYNRTKHLDQRARMMQRWADYLDELKLGSS